MEQGETCFGAMPIWRLIYHPTNRFMELSPVPRTDSRSGRLSKKWPLLICRKCAPSNRKVPTTWEDIVSVEMWLMKWLDVYALKVNPLDCWPCLIAHHQMPVMKRSPGGGLDM